MCRRLDRELRMPYALYILSYGGNVVKVGLTRRFRVYDRIAEQPHIVATRFMEFTSAYEARSMEQVIGSSEYASERRLRGGKESLQEALSQLLAIVDKLSVKFGVNHEHRFFRVIPKEEVTGFKIRIADLGELNGLEMELYSYMYGNIVFKADSRYYLVRSKDIMHRTLWDFIAGSRNLYQG